MKRILITGISGVGKSTVIAALSARGYSAVDADTNEYSHWVAADTVAHAAGTPVEAERDWVWRADRMAALLAHETDVLLFVSGTSPNMGRFLPHFDRVILLSAPAGLIAERLATRTTNNYGKDPAELERVLDQIDSVEPLLRQIAHTEIDTAVALNEVIDKVLQCAQMTIGP